MYHNVWLLSDVRMVNSCRYCLHHNDIAAITRALRFCFAMPIVSALDSVRHDDVATWLQSLSVNFLHEGSKSFFRGSSPADMPTATNHRQH